MTNDDRDELQALAEERFGTAADIPIAYVRELRRYLDAATTKIGFTLDKHDHAAHWIAGRSLGTLSCRATSDDALATAGDDPEKKKPLICQIIRLDLLAALDIEIAVGKESDGVRSQGRRLRIGEHIDLNAWPGGGQLPEKCLEIEGFIDAVVAVVTGT